MSEELFKTPGQIEFDGIKYTGGQHPAVLTRIRDELQLNRDDVLSVSFPKTGSTWVNEILLLIKLGVDEQKWRRIPRMGRFPYIELDPPVGPMAAPGSTYEAVMNTPSPRLIKSHLQVKFFTRHLHADGPRIVVAMRNPKDVLVSYYHFYRANRGLGNFPGTWDEFFNLHKHDALAYGKPCKHMAEWWQQRDQKNVFIIKYEDLKKHTEKVIRDLVTFLGKDFTDQQIDDIIRLSSIDSLRQNSADMDKESPHFRAVIDQKISAFFRKGMVGDYKNYFSKEQESFVEKEIQEMFEESGLEFDYE